MTINGTGFGYGTLGHVLTSNGPNVYPSFQAVSGGNSVNPAVGNYNFEDYDKFEYQSVFAANAFNNGNIFVSFLSEPNHPGILAFSGYRPIENCYMGTGKSTGSNINGLAYDANNDGPLTIECLVKFETLSTSTYRYIWFSGISQTPQATNSAAYLVVKYQDNINSGRFVFESKNSVTGTTTVNTTFTVSTGVWYKITVVTTGSQAQLFVNGVLEATITTNLPNQQGSLGLGQYGLTGSGYGPSNPKVFFRLDYLYTQKVLTTPR